MKKYWKKILFIALITSLAGIAFKIFGHFLTVESFKENSKELRIFVHNHYVLSLAVLAFSFLSTAFCVPGALALTIGSGFLFGAGPGALYAALFLTAGSVLAFLASRHLIGHAIQRTFKRELIRFNAEIDQYGKNYLFILRVLPVLPAFVVNYLSGMTRMSVTRFAIVTFVAMLPGAVVYSLAGKQLAGIQSAKEILSRNVLVGLGLMACLALAPVVVARIREKKAQNKKSPGREPGLIP